MGQGVWLARGLDGCAGDRMCRMRGRSLVSSGVGLGKILTDKVATRVT